MTTALLNRRRLLAALGLIMAARASGLLLPARADGFAPTESMTGGSNNYRKGAAIVDRIGKGGFWMSGTVRRAGDGAPLAGQRIPDLGAHGRRAGARTAGRPRSPTRTGRSALKCHRSFQSSVSRMVISPMTAVNSKPSSCGR